MEREMKTINKENMLCQKEFEDLVDKAALTMFRDGKTPMEKYSEFEGADGPYGMSLTLEYRVGSDSTFHELDYNAFAKAFSESYNWSENPPADELRYRTQRKRATHDAGDGYGLYEYVLAGNDGMGYIHH